MEEDFDDSADTTTLDELTTYRNYRTNQKFHEKRKEMKMKTRLQTSRLNTRDKDEMPRK